MLTASHPLSLPSAAQGCWEQHRSHPSPQLSQKLQAQSSGPAAQPQKWAEPGPAHSWRCCQWINYFSEETMWHEGSGAHKASTAIRPGMHWANAGCRKPTLRLGESPPTIIPACSYKSQFCLWLSPRAVRHRLEAASSATGWE